MRHRTLLLLWAAVLAACGPGPSSGPADEPASTLPLRSAPGARWAAGENTLGVEAVNRLFDFGELRYPQLFPGHQVNRTLDGWTYRYYPTTGIYLGNLGDTVYVMGGPFGSTPRAQGSVWDYLAGSGAPVAVETGAIPASVTAGDFVGVPAAAFDAGGKALAAQPLQWRTSDAAVAQVNGHGLIMVTGPGHATVSVSAGTATATLSVHALPREVPAGQVLVLTGPEEIVFDGEAGRCDDSDGPDTPTGFVRLADGTLMMLASNEPNNYVSFGPDFWNLRRACQPAFASQRDQTPQSYRNWEWLHAVFREGSVVHALVHNEFYDLEHPNCAPDPVLGIPCWYNSVTYARSTDGGRTFERPAGRSVIAPAPMSWEPGGPYAHSMQGYFNPSNIVAPGDGFFYAMFMAFINPDPAVANTTGFCAMRTDNLSDPASWRAWDGSSFALAMRSPYDGAGPAQACTLVAPHGGYSLTYNQYLQRFMMVESLCTDDSGEMTCGIDYSVSTDLVHWSSQHRIRGTHTPPWSGPFPPGPGENADFNPSIVDHASSSVNFDLAGQTPHLYFTRAVGGRDQRLVVRQPLILLKSPSFNEDLTNPTAALETPAPDAVLAGATADVHGWAFDASGLLSVEVWVDALHAGSATLHISRPDVAQGVPGAPADAGFSFALDTRSYADGPHRLTVNAVDRQGNVFSLVRPVTIRNDPRVAARTVAPRRLR